MVTRASASQSVELEFIYQVESYQKTLKMVFTASLLGAQHYRNSEENKPPSLLVVYLGMTFNGMPPSLYGRQMAGAKQSTRRGGPVQLKTSKTSYLEAHNLRSFSKKNLAHTWKKNNLSKVFGMATVLIFREHFSRYLNTNMV